MDSKLKPIDTHDFDFVNELPTESVCVICQFALKDPIQNADCGHRFCTVCFENFKEYASKNSKKLLCPMDRSVINSNHVFRDKAAERFILNQKVYCSNNTNGCIWIGELRHHQNHIKRCNSKKHKDIDHLLETIEKQKSLLSNKEMELLTYEKAWKTKEQLIERLNEKNRCLSKMLENQKSTLYHKEQEILEHNQLILKHKEAMEQTVASMEQEKTREIGHLLEFIEDQKISLSSKEQELMTSEQARKMKEVLINRLNEKIRIMRERLQENKEKAKYYETQMKRLEEMEDSEAFLKLKVELMEVESERLNRTIENYDRKLVQEVVKNKRIADTCNELRNENNNVKNKTNEVSQCLRELKRENEEKIKIMKVFLLLMVIYGLGVTFVLAQCKDIQNGTKIFLNAFK